MILHTKLHIPHVSRESLIERPALIKMLNEGLKTKLTSITAPAGYGKTTVLSEWTRQCSCPVAWISLDRYDNDLVQFWSYVIAAVEQAYPNVSDGITPQLASLNTETFEPFITALLNGLNKISGNLVVILDDFHVIQLSAIHDSIAYMIEHVPVHIHIYIASRFELPFPAARLHAKGNLHKIVVADLRFQLEEGIRFFRDGMSLLLSNEEAAKLVRRTEGWVSGLHLAALALKRSDDPSAYIRDFSGQQRSIAQYLLEELLERQSEEVRHFLLHTSILTRMNRSLCEAITGQANGQEQLEGLERINLFIIRLDEQGEWFRYHHLFADFLQQQFHRKHPDRWAKTHENAARWLEQHGFPEEAVEHLLIGEHHFEAAALIEKRLSDFQDNRSSLKSWLEVLPESVLSKKPAIQFLHIKIMAEAGNVNWAESKLRDVEAQLSEPDWKPWNGTFYFLSAEIAVYRRDVPRAIRYVELFEQHEPQGIPLQMIAGNTLNGLGFENLLVFFHDLHDAEELMLKCINIWKTKDHYPYLGYAYLTYCEVLYEWGRTEEAEFYVNLILHDRQWQPFLRIYFRATIKLAFMSLMKGDNEHAFALLEQVEEKLDTPEKQLFVRRLAAEKANLSIHGGLIDEVIAWVESCGFKHTDPIPLRYREYYILARALMEIGQTEHALHLLERLFQLVNEKDWLRDKIKILILQSISFYRQGKEVEALIRLERALHLAEPQGYIRSFTDEGKDLANLFVHYLRNRQTGFIRQSLPVSLLYVKKLLHRMNVHLEGARVLPTLLTEQEINILRLIEQGFKNQEIAELLKVSSETVKKHIKNIYHKLEVNSRLQAVKSAKELNLL
ncbi:MAG: LuxR C-terminal-related transcriptional regulator [Clostridia bacterium]